MSSLVFAAMAASVALAALVGWLADIQILTSYAAGLSTMKANTACAVLLIAAASWLVGSPGGEWTWRRGVALLLSTLVLLLALLTIGEYVFGRDWGIDEILVRDPTASANTSAPGRMGLHTAIGLALSSVAIVLFATRRAAAITIGQVCALVVAGISLITSLGYVHSVTFLAAIRSYTQMSVPTTVSLLCLAGALLGTYPRSGLMESVTSPHAGGAMMRRLLPATVAVPFGIAWIVQAGERAGLYSADLSLPLVVALTILGLTVLLWVSAVSVNKADEVQKGVTERLSQSEARFRSLFDNVVEGVFQADQIGRFLIVNPALVRLLGYEHAEELLSLQPTDLYESDEQRNALVSQLIRDRQLRDAQVLLTRKDGIRIPVLINARVVDSDGATYHEGTVTDITEHARLERQLRQAQKMEAIGQLAGGVAHDFNNILTAIIGYSEALLEDSEESSPMREGLQEIKKAGDRAAVLTRQLLAFSRQQVLQPAVVDLNALASNLAQMLRRVMGGNVQLILKRDAALGAIKADPGQIEQVILNLAVNARDAMPDGGRLTIETANVELDETRGRDHGIANLVPGGFVMIAVSDTGIGMDEDTKRRVFEPFFTTKPRDRGTGLGLATVYGIVKQSQGYVWVVSELGRGTTFSVYLPRVDEPITSAPQPAVNVSVVGGSETILLVEDEESVRLLSRALLERNGYHVLEAENAAEAFDKASTCTRPIDLLLTDVMLPGESGPQLFERVRKIQPSVRVLYMSGYADQAIVDRGMFEAGSPFLQKPFLGTTLARKVRDVLDAHPLESE
jgi:two-component system, cell cycle sensor histidine kinase and response regulator CckA